MRLLGANSTATVTGADQQPGRSNYIVGNDPKKWHTNIPQFGQVKVAGVYPGIDVLYHGSNQRQLEYDFVVAPGADPNRIRLRVDGADSLALDHDGDLVMRTHAGDVLEHAPIVYQKIDGARQQVNGHYVLRNKHDVAFQLAKYDARNPVVIDPVLTYATFVGGTGFDVPYGIVSDSAGNAYITGVTTSTDYPVTAGSFQTSGRGGGNSGFASAFVTK